MKLVDFQGLNCYQNSLVTIAAALGVDYIRAFSNLWPETDFSYNQDHQVFITKRMLENLTSLGMMPEALPFTTGAEALHVLSELPPGEPLLVCMDTFYIPWSPAFGAIHDAHYFAARKEPSGLLSCFDPTYNALYTLRDELTPRFSKVYRIVQGPETPLPAGDCREEILRDHPQTRNRLLDDFAACINGDRKRTLLLAKYVDAMISNRYLYQHYLDHDPAVSSSQRQFFDHRFFTRWEAVKYGLYRAIVAKDNADTIHEVSGEFRRLMDEELRLAAQV